MPKMIINDRNLQQDTLRKMRAKRPEKAHLIDLRLEYKEKAHRLSNYIHPLVHEDRIYPTHLPTQSSFRWSTINPPLTGFERDCINPHCPQAEHEWTEECWSVRDIVLPDEGESLVTWDHDNIEGRIHDLYLGDEENLEAHRQGYDLHTLTCCTMFGMDLPTDHRDPHRSAVDAGWRTKYAWQGKDTQRRVLAKNFNHGSKYTTTPNFVHAIKGIEQYGISRSGLVALATAYMASKKAIFDRKRKVMDRIRRAKEARNLYGARRLFYDSSHETAKEGFSFVISSTVSLYNNETLITMHRRWPYCRLIHNAHDGDKVCFPSESVPPIEELRGMIERPMKWEGREVLLTAGIKVHSHE